MSSGNVFERLFRLWATITKMIVDGARKAEEVAEWLQVVVARADFATLLTAPPREASVKTEPEGGWEQEWTKFYQEVFGLEVDLSHVEMLEAKPGFGWAVFVPQGMTLNIAWQTCQEMFPSYSHLGDDLDRVVPRNDRSASEASYGKRIRNRVEADQENKNRSANDLAPQELQSITLLERFLLELWYFWKTGGGHLDLVNVTMCAGSRNIDGNVLGTDWYDCRFRVGSYNSGDAANNLRSRSV